MLNKIKSIPLVIALLFSFFVISVPAGHIYAAPYGDGNYGACEYNAADASCNGTATDSGGLADTGTNLLLIGGGAVILIGVALSTIIAKRKNKK